MEGVGAEVEVVVAERLCGRSGGLEERECLTALVFVREGTGGEDIAGSDDDGVGGCLEGRREPCDTLGAVEGVLDIGVVEERWHAITLS